MVIFGGVGIFTGLFGVLTAFCSKCLCIGFYAFLSFVVAIIFGAIGIALIIIGSLGS